MAAETGRLAVLQWAHAHGCPWDHSTCDAAAARGDLVMLKWARANNCPWSGDAALRAAYNWHTQVFRWAIENGCPWEHDAMTMHAWHTGIEEAQAWLATLAVPVALSPETPRLSERLARPLMCPETVVASGLRSMYYD